MRKNLFGVFHVISWQNVKYFKRTWSLQFESQPWSRCGVAILTPGIVAGTASTSLYPVPCSHPTSNTHSHYNAPPQYSPPSFIQMSALQPLWSRRLKLLCYFMHDIPIIFTIWRTPTIRACVCDNAWLCHFYYHFYFLIRFLNEY